MGNEGDTPFIVMDYIDGSSLDKIARNPKDNTFPRGDRTIDGRPSGLEAMAAVKLTNEIGRALDYAHSQGIVHRDIKPANVMLNADKKPMITDFGLAKDLSESSQRLTKDGATLGTALYMAPEQAAGEQEKVGPRSDVYSLGAMFYQLLTGRPPFEGTETMALLSKVITTDALPPSSIIPTLDRQLDIICMKALEKEPERRYESAGEMAEDLFRFMKGEHILAEAPSFEFRARRWARRRRTPIAASVLVAVALVVAGWFALQNEGVRKRMGFLESALTGKQEAEDRHNRALKQLAEAQSAFGQVVLAARQGDQKSLPTALDRVAANVKKTLEIEPDMAEARLVDAAALRWAGKPSAAAIALDAMIAAKPDFAGARFERGMIRIGEYANRLADARVRAIAPGMLLDPPDPGWTAPAAFEKADPDLAKLRAAAAADLAQVGAWPEEPAKAALAQGLASALGDAPASARAAIEIAAAQSDALEEAYWALAHVAFHEAKPDAALAALAEYLKRNRGAGFVHRDRLAAALAAALAAPGPESLETLRGELDAAGESFVPGPVVRGWIAVQRAGAAKAEGKTILLEAATAGWKDVLPGDPRAERLRARLWGELAELLIAARRDPEALAAQAELIAAIGRADPEGKDLDLLQRRARAFARLAAGERVGGKDSRETFRKAIVDYDALLAAQANEPSWIRERGVARHDLAQAMAEQKEEPRDAFARAADDLSKTLELTPNDAEARRMRIRCYAGICGQFAIEGNQAEKYKYAELMRVDCAEAVKAYPEDSELWQLLGNAEATLASWIDVPQERRTEYFGSAEEHYRTAAEKGAKFAHYGLGMLYYTTGHGERALKAFRKFRVAVPDDNPELDKLIDGLEQAVNRGAARELDGAYDLMMQGKLVDADQEFEEGFRKFYGYLKLCSVEEVEKILSENSNKIAVSHYNYACLLSQASVGKAGKQSRPMPNKEEAKALANRAFEQLDEALKLGFGKEVREVEEGGQKVQKVVTSKTALEQTQKDTDLDPLHADPRWKKLIEKIQK